MVHLYKHISVLIVLLATFLFSSNVYSQQGRLPTKQELDTKLELQQLYLSSANSINKNGSPNHIMITGPEQDCDNAIPVCSQTYTQTQSYTGHGTSQEVNGTCLSSKETNSVWYVFTVQNSGTFTFMLNTPNDYDFALYNITTTGCVGVPSATPIRCNYSATYGNTGLTLPAAGGNLSYNASQSPIMAGVNVTAGQTFVLIIDNYSANSNGYTLTFGGTAQIFDNTPPTIASSNFPCNGSLVNINFSEPVNCNSIATNGSDFTITGPSGNVPITSAVGNLCGTGASNTNFATVNFNNTGLPSGTYTVTVNTGTDGNTILDKCGNVMTSQSFTFQYLAPISISATNSLVCAGGVTTLSVVVPGNPSGVTYTWSPSASNTSSLVVNPNQTNTYNVAITYGGCTRSASQIITVGQPPVVTVNPNNISLCAGTTTLTASSTMGGLPCINCNYTWSGSSTQVDNGVTTSSLPSAGAGTYSVLVTSSAGCVGNIAVSNVSILSPSSAPACNIIYASPTGTGSGLTAAAPTDIQTALTLAACNSIVIKMQFGDYTINNPLTVNSFVTMEGGYNTAFTLKSSGTATTGGFPNQGTRIIRSTANLEGTAGNSRYTAISIVTGSSYFRLQDLSILMPTNAAGTSISNYGIYLGSGCSNYNITRCFVNVGAAGSGSVGVTAAGTANAGGNGGNGSAGDIDDQEDAGAGGGGGGGGGTTVGNNGGNGSGAFGTANNCSLIGGTLGLAGTSGGNGGVGASDPDGCGFGSVGATGGAGLISSNSRSGGGGGGGGSGGSEKKDGGPGGVGGGVLSVFGNNTTGGVGGGGGNPGGSGSVGATGIAGGTGAAGIAGSLGDDATGFWVIGSQGGNGVDGQGGQGGKGGGGGGGQGCTLCTDGAGSGGGGGGAGGQGGVGGTGGVGGGSAFGIFIFNNGLNGNVVDCEIPILAGAAGAGGSGGAGSTGGNGGIGGLGSTYGGSETGKGGNGGNGGKGGNGGAGGSGSSGIANAVRLVGGSALVSNIASFTLTTQPVLTSENKACTNVSIAHTSTVTTPSWSSFGASAIPASGSGSPASTVYSTVGRKTLNLNTSNYTDFNNIIVAPPSTGSIIASASSICPGSANFVSTAIATAGLSYSWTVLPAGATLSSTSTSSTSSLFTNAGTTPITYTLTLQINSQCCGNLTPVTTTIVVNPIPIPPSGVVNSICIGGVATYSATAPIGNSFNWYNDPTASTLLGTGNTYTVSNVTTSNTVYLQATNAAGCSSTTTPVVVTPTAVLPPTVIPGSSCDIGLVQVGINPVAGVTDYNWYSDAGGTTLVQTGNSLNYSQNIVAAGGSYIVYVQSTVAGCSPSSLVAVTASVSATPITLVQSILPNDTVCVNTPIILSLNPGGGNGTFAYSWSPLTSTLSSISQTITNSTSYNVIITSNGCAKLFYIPIIVNPIPKDSIGIPLSISCSNNLVTLDGSFSESGTNITYNWTTTGGNIVSSATSNTISVNSAGNYSLLVTNTLTGCSSTQTVAVSGSSSLPTLTLTTSSNTLTCASPTIQLNASTSTSGVTYSWTTIGGAISSTNTANPIATASGTYIVVVTNTATGCQSTETVAIVPDASIPTISITANNLSITCTNTTVTTALTSTSTITSYSWNPTPLSGGANPIFGASGVYNATVTANNGCSTIISVNVTEDNLPPVVSFSTATNNGIINCYNPSLTVTASTTVNPISNLSYTWTGGSGLSSPSNQASATFTAAGIYTVIVTNTVTGCVTSATNTANTFTVVSDFTTPTGTVTTLSTNTVIGCGAGNSTVTLISTVSNTNTTLSWLPSGVSTPSLDVTSAGIYTLVITNAVNGCSDTTEFTVNGNTTPPQNVDAGSATSVGCGTSTVTLQGITSSTSNVSYSWAGPSGTSIISGGNTANSIVTEVGQYTLTVTDNLTGCQNTDTVNVILSTATASISANPTTGTSPLDVAFTGTGLGNPNFSWNFGDGNVSTNQNPNNIFTSGTYTVVLTTTSGSCTATTSVVIVVEDGLTLEIPNVFTPNNDASNDIFTIKSSGVKEISLQIFNRWGQKLYEFAGAKAAWDGSTPSGTQVPEGTYFYFVKATGFDGTEVEKNGTVNLFR